MNKLERVKGVLRKHEKLTYFVGGIIAGGIGEEIFGPDSNIENMLETAFAAGIVVPLFRRYVSNFDWSESYKNVTPFASGIIIGQTIVKYLKQ